MLDFYLPFMCLWKCKPKFLLLLVDSYLKDINTFVGEFKDTK